MENEPADAGDDTLHVPLELLELHEAAAWEAAVDDLGESEEGPS